MAGTTAVKQQGYVSQQAEEESPRHGGTQFLSPSKLALTYADQIYRSTLNEKESAPVRYAFIDARNEGSSPPMTQMLRGGRGGAVRLKLYLSLLWFGNPPKPLTYPAPAWAKLLGLDEPDTNGARRVTAAFHWLAQRRFITLASRQGHPPDVRIRQEDGSGVAYTVPWAARRDAKRRQGAKALKDSHLYIKLPSTFWTNGWIGILSAPAVAMLLVLLRLAGKSLRKRIWISPSEAELRFGLSEDTRTAGVRELAAYGLLSISKHSVDPNTFDWRRVRNVYRLDLDRLDSRPDGEAADSDTFEMEDD